MTPMGTTPPPPGFILEDFNTREGLEDFPARGEPVGRRKIRQNNKTEQLSEAGGSEITLEKDPEDGATQDVFEYISKDQLLSYVEYLWADAAFMRALHEETVSYADNTCKAQ